MRPCQEVPGTLLWPLPLIPPEAHPGCGTTIHVEDLSCDEVRRVGDEKGDRRCYVLGVAYSPQGDEGVAELCGVARDVEVAGDLYYARAYGVHPDLAVRELDGELAGEGVDRAFRRRVGRVMGEAREPVNRGYVDDAPAAPLHHERHGLPGQEEVTLHVQ